MQNKLALHILLFQFTSTTGEINIMSKSLPTKSKNMHTTNVDEVPVSKYVLLIMSCANWAGGDHCTLTLQRAQVRQPVQKVGQKENYPVVWRRKKVES